LRLGAWLACSLLAAAGAGKAEARTLTFDERVRAQEAIEQVYWSHRIWPDANPNPKPPLAAILTESALRAKTERALRLSITVESARREPLTGAELQEEMERMAAETQAPDMLRELFAALGDDPVLIAECLARPSLVSRLAAAAGVHDDGIRRDAAELDRLTIVPPVTGYTVPSIGGFPCVDDDSWALSSLANGTGARLPSARQLHTAVWTGAELIVWGGWDGGNGAFNDGGVYQPATDSWLVSALATPVGANVPSQRYRHTAVWTGTEMIVWGGRDAAGTALNNGGRYDLAADAWVPSTLVNAAGTNVPTARQFHAAVWTGTQMIVWGGSPDTVANALNNGGVFDAASDGWIVSSLFNAAGAFVPVARIDHTAIWTGTEMIVWGGRGTGGSDLNDGGVYQAAADAWRNTVLTNGGGTLAASARHFHTAVWTGTEMIVWGGASGTGSLNTGGRYSVGANAWLSSSLKNAGGTRVPTARQLHTAIWTGGEMIVWGGSTDGGSGVLNTGGRYSPVSDAWAVSSLTNGTGVRVPTARQYHTANWVGGEMIVWGGSSGTPTGGRFCVTCANSAWHADADGDGYGDPAATTLACTAPAGFVASASDCDDTDPAIHPGAAEVCDGLDDDCDTVIDNGDDALCADADVCSADVCTGTGGCAAPPASANLDVTGFSILRVDGRDLVVLADAWNSCPGDLRYNAAANLDQGTTPPDSCVDLSDFHLFMNSFGQTCP
jgi:hypothetical protein